MADSADRIHYIEALSISRAASEVLDVVEAVLQDSGAEVKSRTDTALEALVVSGIFRFKDDVQFFVDEGERRLHARSASRMGYSDLGANRKRINELFGRIDSQLNAR